MQGLLLVLEARLVPNRQMFQLILMMQRGLVSVGQVFELLFKVFAKALFIALVLQSPSPAC